jgi:hypothetical protein
VKQLIFFENEVIQAKRDMNKYLCLMYEVGKYINKYSPSLNRMFLTQCKDEFLKGLK